MHARVPCGVPCELLGSLRNDDDDGNENGNKAIGLDKQNNNFARASRPFLYIYLPSLHDYNYDFFYFLFLLMESLRIQLQKKIADIWRIIRDGISLIKFEAEQIHFLSDVFAAIAVVVA